MRTAYFDIIGGIAGDMSMASLVSAGVSLDDLVQRLSSLPVQNFEVLGRHVSRNGIDAVQLEVIVHQQNEKHRHLHHILGILDESDLSQHTKDLAKSVFRVLAEAEAKVHNTTVEKVHFHEVGAVDAIVDVVGTTLCLEMLGVGQVFTSPVKMGGQGFVKAAHGKLPVASPAAVEILRGYPVLMTDAPHELTTPTGAAIVKALSSGMMPDQPFVADAIGYGAGTAEFAELPNLLRVFIGELEGTGEGEFIDLVETTIDDMNPQFYPFLLETLLAKGARDAYLTPVIMKKGRPGILLSVLTESSKLPLITETIYANTSTIGLRVQRVSRRILPREAMVIDTAFGPVRAKAVFRNGRREITAEFEECRRISLEKNLPLPEVYRIIERDLPTSTEG
jgi:uncharacterized protein (TIGR00299 family) protein